MSYQETLIYLDSLTDHAKQLHLLTGAEFDLNRITHFLHDIGDPQKKLKIVHVAGSKGKGSICSMIASILCEAGYKVGLYTSPHLHDLRERIRILDATDKNKSDEFFGMINKKDFERLINLLKHQHDSDMAKGLPPLTYFEMLTALAFAYFDEQSADISVIETGLGGRLDATNVADSIIAVIAPIGLEHTNILGATLEKIACEKAGIIKPSNKSVVIARQSQIAGDAVIKKCNDLKVNYIEAAIETSLTLKTETNKKQVFDIETKRNKLAGISLPLAGRHQRENAGTAYTVIESLMGQGFDIQQEAVYKGLDFVRWPGRFEIMCEHPIVILDAAHNEESALALTSTLKDIFDKRKIIAILGQSADKDIKKFAKVLNPFLHTVIGAQAKHPRAMLFSLKDMGAWFPGRQTFLSTNVTDACMKAWDMAGTEDVILITGSLFVVAEARDFFNKKANGEK